MEIGTQKVKSLFMLDANITYLNHGSFGACPKPIFNSLIKWQKELEKEPVKYLAHDIAENLSNSRFSLSKYINCNKDDLVFFPNPSTALNTVLRSLDLKHGDEILTTNHEYGAMDRAWRFLCKKTGAKYINQKISLPLEDKEFFIKEFKKGITDKTKIIFLSHVTSPTALIFPVKEICNIAREKGIITIIDGAHAPGQIDLDIEDINPDFYSGACHKWMCSPKGVAFLYAKKEIQHIIEPLVISWGYESEKPSHSQFLDYLQWQGTNDISAYLTIPDVIRFLEEYSWTDFSVKCSDLNLWAHQKVLESFNIEPLSSNQFLAQMNSFYFNYEDSINCQLEFYKKYKIQIPFFSWNNKQLIRISVQAYNNKNDILYLIDSLKDFNQ